MISVRTSTGLRVMQSLRVRTSSGLRAMQSAQVRTSSGLRTMFNPTGDDFDVTATPLTSYGGRAQAGPVSIATEAIYVTPSGGTAPYTYAWTVIDAGGGFWTIETPTGAASRLICDGVADGDYFTGTFRCTVTDANAGSGFIDISATVQNYGDLHVFY